VRKAQGECSHHLHKRRVLGVDAEISALQVPVASGEVKALIEGLRHP
jgi:hypothetical protein